jgi:hypothetical protein
MSRKLRKHNQQQNSEAQTPSTPQAPQADIPRMIYDRPLRPSVVVDEATGALTPEYTEGK